MGEILKSLMYFLLNFLQKWVARLYFCSKLGRLMHASLGHPSTDGSVVLSYTTHRIPFNVD